MPEPQLRRVAERQVRDPFVPAVQVGAVSMEAVAAERALGDGIDCAAITTAHRGVDYEAVVRRAPLVVDTRNALARFDAAHIFRL